jgi:hypothetical protein
MRRPSTRISSLFEATACLAGALTACLSSVTVDLGSNYREPVVVEAAAPSPPVVEEPGAVAPIAAPPDAEDDVPPETSPDSLPADETVTPSQICIPNPSFEPLLDRDAGPIPVLPSPPLWRLCSANALTPQRCILPPADQSSYLGLSIGLAPYLYNPAAIDAALSCNMQPGVTYSLQLELGLDAPETDGDPGGEPPALQVRGSTMACDPRADLLARFSGATNTCGWKLLCATFVAQQAYSDLMLIPEATSSTGVIYSQTALLVDDLRSGVTCPPR